MKLVDRYIVRVFTRVFLICFATLMGMYLVADFVNNLAELLRYGKSHGGLWRVLLGYYGPQIPWFFDLTSRLAALIAAVFAVTWLQRNNEMAALMAAGVSRWRIVKPLFVCAVLVSVLAALNREWLIPRLGHALAREARNYDGDQSETLHPRYDHATDIFINGAAVVPASQEIERPKLRLPASLAQNGAQLAARRAKFLASTTEHPAGFLLIGVAQPVGVDRFRTLTVERQPVVIAPSDAAWLKEDQLFVVSSLPFSHFQEGNNWRRFASTFDLVRGMHNAGLGYGADVSVTIHSRLVQPILDVLLVFLGLPLVLARESQNAFIAAGRCLLITMAFLVVVLACQGLGMNYVIRPSLAAWCPLMLFVPMASLMSEPLRR
jgi:lipopolysaccharide export system permease protein